MVEITWTRLAIRDLEDIEDYIAKDSHVYAVITIEKIFSRVETLAKHPNSGRIVPEFENKKIRELIEGNYRIVYFIGETKEISILRIHHSARLLT